MDNRRDFNEYGNFTEIQWGILGPILIVILTVVCLGCSLGLAWLLRKPEATPNGSVSTLESQAAAQGRTIPWALDLSEWPNRPVKPEHVPAPEAFVRDLTAKLRDTKGWERAHISFVYTDQLPRARIVIQILNRDDMTATVRSKLARGGATVQTGQCRIFLREDVPDRDRPMSYEPIATVTLNHQLGHCFGFGHGRRGLMQERYDVESQLWSDGDAYPGADLIGALSLRPDIIRPADHK